MPLLCVAHVFYSRKARVALKCTLYPKVVYHLPYPSLVCVGVTAAHQVALPEDSEPSLLYYSEALPQWWELPLDLLVTQILPPKPTAPYVPQNQGERILQEQHWSWCQRYTVGTCQHSPNGKCQECKGPIHTLNQLCSFCAAVNGLNSCCGNKPSWTEDSFDKGNTVTRELIEELQTAYHSLKTEQLRHNALLALFSVCKDFHRALRPLLRRKNERKWTTFLENRVFIHKALFHTHL